MKEASHTVLEESTCAVLFMKDSSKTVKKTVLVASSIAMVATMLVIGRMTCKMAPENWLSALPGVQ